MPRVGKCSSICVVRSTNSFDPLNIRCFNPYIKTATQYARDRLPPRQRQTRITRKPRNDRTSKQEVDSISISGPDRRPAAPRAPHMLPQCATSCQALQIAIRRTMPRARVLPLRQFGLAIQLRLPTKATLSQLRLTPKRTWKLRLRQTQTKLKQMPY